MHNITEQEIKKKNLINELIKEKNRLEGIGKDVTDHILALQYLEHGIMPKKINTSYEILNDCIYDFDSIYNDYCG